MDESIDRHRLLARSPSATFLYRADGWSILGVGISDGDILVVDRSVTPQAGDLVIPVWDGNRPTSKVLKTFEHHLELHSANPQFPPIVLDQGTEVRSSRWWVWCARFNGGAAMFGVVDGNNFYASCERVFQPKLRGVPMVVLSNNDGCAIARSAEAKALGIKMGHPAHELKLQRLQLAMMAKGINGTLIMDAAEEYEQKQLQFGGLTDVLMSFMQMASGAADIPMTRLMSQSPGGLNATGESDLRNYYDRISSGQELVLSPALQVLDECLIPSALGTRPEEVFYNWRSLWQTTDKERADIGKTTTESIKIVSETKLIPDDVMTTVAVNMLTEAGVAPGLESEWPSTRCRRPKATIRTTTKRRGRQPRRLSMRHLARSMSAATSRTSARSLPGRGGRHHRFCATSYTSPSSTPARHSTGSRPTTPMIGVRTAGMSW